MNKEINKIIANLEGCVGMFDYMLTPTESNLLVSHLKELQQENKKQKEVIDKATDIINDYLKEDYSIYTENEIEVDLIVKLKNILKEVSK